MDDMDSFIDRNKHFQDYGDDCDNRGFIMDSIFDTSRDKSYEKLEKATKYLRNLSFDANEKNSLIQQIEDAEISYQLFHRKLDTEEQEKNSKLTRRRQKPVVVHPENFNKIDPYEKNIIDKIKHKKPIFLKDIKMDYSIYYNYKQRKLFDKKALLAKKKLFQAAEEIRRNMTRNRYRSKCQKFDKKEMSLTMSSSFDRKYKSNQISPDSSIFEQKEHGLPKELFMGKSNFKIPCSIKVDQNQASTMVSLRRKNSSPESRNLNFQKSPSKIAKEEAKKLADSKDSLLKSELPPALKSGTLISSKQKVRVNTKQAPRKSKKRRFMKTFAESPRKSAMKSTVSTSFLNMKREGVKTLNVNQNSNGLPRRGALVTIREPKMGSSSKAIHTLNSNKAHQDSNENTRKSSKKRLASYFQSRRYKTQKLRHKFYSISKACDDATLKGREDMRELLFERFKHKIQDQEFKKTLSLMESLDFATTNSLSIMYDYMKGDIDESIQNQLCIMEDYNSGKGDPSRVVARIERATKKKKDIVKKKTGRF
ncbi:unnamed protein product [Moneuplotes crassus]|uniref:Uncharacterized protein n=1 Tax=Euplotes crassus TaxID=5936 RepID=A0AAD1X713_EUPCR|nr:unnamed protein product [Moneuplotes crassus]